MLKIGAHVSAAVSLETAFERAGHIGANCFQIFVSPPQQWLQTKHSQDEIERFLQKAQKTRLGPNYIHGTYLINLGTRTSEHLIKSIEWLIYGLNLAEKLQIEGLVFHIGSHKGAGFEAVEKQVVESIKKVLDKTENVKLILETSAGSGGSIGKSFSELGAIIKQVKSERLKVCLDTQHVFASGYNIVSAVGLKDVLAEFEQEIGLANLTLIHTNDSKAGYNSNLDRHENIGEGFIGKEGFENIINHPDLKKLPFILEVPGFYKDGPDKENIQLLRSLVR